MAYSPAEQSRRDLDWFFSDNSGRIFHVASGGGILPNLISEGDEINRQLSNRILRLPEKYDVEINLSVFEIIGYSARSESDRRIYLESFINFAKRGIYSYDNSVLGVFDNNKYHLVAKPKRGYLSFNEIRDEVIIKMPLTKTDFDFNYKNKFDLINLIK